MIFKIDNFVHGYPKSMFDKVLVGVTDKVNHDIIQNELKIHQKAKKVPTLQDEFNIDGLFIAWVWYIIIMLISIFLNGRVLVWIWATIIFFNYRRKKLRKAGF